MRPNVSQYKHVGSSVTNRLYDLVTAHQLQRLVKHIQSHTDISYLYWFHFSVVSVEYHILWYIHGRE